jgi:hypothetical protein
MALDTPSTRITGQFKELQQLRKPVHEARIEFLAKEKKSS